MKTCQEWSLAFDQLYNNITSNKAPGLNEYEKSVFLTDAQDVIVTGLYNGSFGKAFESTEDVTNYLAPLVRQVDMVEETMIPDLLAMRVDPDNGHIYHLPNDADPILFRTLELCTIASDCNPDGERAVVVPVTQDEYWRTVNDPFKKHNHRRVLRLSFTVADNMGPVLVTHKFCELISEKEIMSYVLRYIARPEPIILEDLHGEGEEGLTINGYYTAQPCLLDEAIHQVILSEAVRAAKAAWQS